MRAIARQAQELAIALEKIRQASKELQVLSARMLQARVEIEALTQVLDDDASESRE